MKKKNIVKLCMYLRTGEKFNTIDMVTDIAATFKAQCACEGWLILLAALITIESMILENCE